MDRMHEIVHAAGEAGVNILCLQEAWTMPFACAPGSLAPSCFCPARRIKILVLLKPTLRFM